MTVKIVPVNEIERFVGMARLKHYHVARVDPSGVMYILHSTECKARYTDLRQCDYSLGMEVLLSTGLTLDWGDFMDVPVIVRVIRQFVGHGDGPLLLTPDGETTSLVLDGVFPNEWA